MPNDGTRQKVDGVHAVTRSLMKLFKTGSAAVVSECPHCQVFGKIHDQ